MTSTVDTKRPLSVEDRCDKCQARAMVRATFLTGELYFCGHHAKETGYTLPLKAIEIFDPEGVMQYADR